MLRQEPLTLHQAGLLTVCTYLSAAIRTLPIVSGQYAKQAAFLVPAAGFLLYLLTVECLRRLFRDRDRLDLADALLSVLGPVPGRILLGLAALWFTFQAALYSRQYSIQLTSTVFPNVREPVFLLLLLLPIAAVMTRGVCVLARMNRFVVTFVLSTLALVILGLLRYVEPAHLLPITPDLLPGVGRGAFSAGGHWIFVLTPFLAAPFVRGGEDFHRVLSLRTGLLLLAVGTLIVTVTVGSLSAPMTNHLSLPFLFAVKQIEIASSLQKAEAMIITIWVLSDFVHICLCAMAGLRLLRMALGIREGRAPIPLYLTLIYLLALLLTTASMELTYLTVRLFLPLAAILGLTLVTLPLAARTLRARS